ncbi:MAG TPA: sigma-70 family RNA polymerase sigma factor [Kofleriaceae bacterium]|nr:sigma-70 family RNA polymerase sigma factor [Kofleriaceae bacterium]
MGITNAISGPLQDLVRSVRRAWPTIDVDPERFVAHVARHLPEGLPIETALEQMHTEDLYLAHACAVQDRNALVEFERHCMQGLETTVSRYCSCSDFAMEVKQRVRERALVGDAGPPRIAQFSGRGDLRGWTRVMAIREALAMVRKPREEVSIDEETRLQGFVTEGDADLGHVKTHYVNEFKQAFSEAVRRLPDRERTLLRQHVIDGLSIDQLSVLYGVHRATAGRNLQRARQAVLTTTRHQLVSRLGVRPSEVDSLLRLIRSRIEITLRGLKRRRPTARR